MKKIIIALVFAVLLASSCSNKKDVRDPASEGSVLSESSKTENGETVENALDGKIESSDTEMTENFESVSGIVFPERASVGEYTKESTAIVTLSDSVVELTGKGVTVDDSTVTVTDSGTYVFTGKLSDGQIIVNSNGADKVTLVLNGVEISSSSTAAINVVNSADKVELRLAKGSVNILSDGTTRAETDESNAVVYSRDDLEIENEGTLYVKANFEKGIHSKDDLEIREATVYVESPDDGIRGKDSVRIESGSVFIYSGADGIRTNNVEDEGKGYIEISGGHVEINAGQDAIQAVTDLTVTDGEFVLVSGGGSVNSSMESDSWGNWGGFGGKGDFGRGGRGGMGGLGVPPDGMGGFSDMEVSAETEERTSAKALKASGALTVSGGKFNIDSSDDSVHSNGSVNISGGVFVMNSGDDGIHSDNELVISNGNIIIEKSYEGIEGLDINISGGIINVVAYDDGFNAAGGADGSSMNGRPGQNGFGGAFGGFGGPGGFGGGMAESGVGSILITGGDITVNASGDGLDSNGSYRMDGGKVVVFGPTDGGNGTLDYTTTFLMNEGTLAAIGSTGMAQDISAGSAQARVFVRVSGMSGDEVRVTDQNGSLIFETVCPKQYGCILLSTPDMNAGESYSFYFNGEIAGTVEASMK